MADRSPEDWNPLSPDAHVLERLSGVFRALARLGLIAELGAVYAACEGLRSLRAGVICIHDGDVMYNAPTCCLEALELDEAWWALPAEERFRFPRGACAEDTTAGEARDLLAALRARVA